MADLDNTAYSLSKCSFADLVKSKPVRIPKIQRDYAQGRKNDIAKDIRSKFVHDLVAALNHGTAIELDFIYGSYRKGAFEPLDGQQRLTTLFLLHWICGVPLYDKDGDSAMLSYETRGTSTDFCLELVKHSPEQFLSEIETSKKDKSAAIKEAEQVLSDLSKMDATERPSDYATLVENAVDALAKAKNLPEKTISSLICNRDWFNYLWQYDPTIQSMLVMLDAIHDEFLTQNADIATCRKNLQQITFSNLDLGLFGLSDELFIKMNARGKQLSSFDILKSSLEEEIQVQKGEGRCTIDTESTWRSLIDGEWIDWFWNMHASDEIGLISEPDEEYRRRLGLAKDAEDYLKKLILRSIALRFVANGGANEDLSNICYGDHLGNLDRLLIVYNDSLRSTRTNGALPIASAEIDFPSLIEDITCLYFKENGTYKDIFSLIPEDYNINSDERERSYLDIFLDQNCPNDAKAVFYALRQYAKRWPVVLTDGRPDQKWVDDFSEWAHFVRNLFMYENNNTRIDNPARFIGALEGVNTLITRLSNYLAETPIPSVVGFIQQVGDETFVGVDNQSLAEEVMKANLKLSDQGEWKTLLDDAEAHYYLWGQVRCLLDWADGDKAKFKEYTERLCDFIDYNDRNLVYAGLLSVDPTHGFSNHRLYLFNKERDYGFKRYFRDRSIKDQCGTYAPAVKRFLDAWITTAYNSSLVDFSGDSIRKALSSGHSYVNCLLELPTILNDAWYKMIFLNSAQHYVIAQRKTDSSHCYDIAFEYLFYKYEGNEHLNGEISFFDSVAKTYQHAIILPYGKENILIKELNDGAYNLSIDDEIVEVFENETQMIDYVLATYPL